MKTNKIILILLLMVFLSGSCGLVDEHLLTKTWTEPVTGIKFVWVEKGCYQMGCGDWVRFPQYCQSDTKPLHKVCLDGFWMAKYETTQAQWKTIMGSNPSGFNSKEREECPVENVSWNNVKEFIKKLNKKTNLNFRLPTEAEWEYAARSGGKKEEFAGWYDRSDSFLNDYVWTGCYRPHKVGTKKPNGLWLYDMTGNVWEWCEDIYDKDAYSKHSKNNPLITSGSKYRIFRGGSWGNSKESMYTYIRLREKPDYKGCHIGFRLCITKVKK